MITERTVPNSILNDVLGPVMRGPSSSHTAGAYRIARLVIALCGERPAVVRCAFDPDGSYAPTYLPLGVDKAFCAGLLGIDMLDARYDEAVGDAAAVMCVEFVVEPLEEGVHPNTMRIETTGESGSEIEVWARSVGGGVVEVFRINRSPVSITGKYEQTVEVAERKAGLGCESAKETRIIPPLFYPPTGKILFSSGQALLETESMDDMGHAGLSLGDAGIAYESALLQMTSEELRLEMTRRYGVMVQSISDGRDPDIIELAWLEPHADAVIRRVREGRVPFGGPTTVAAARALAVMHTCNSRGIVCAAPTGGSAGVLPGVLTVLEELYNVPKSRIIRALFAAGVVGLIMANRATFAAEEAGCQVEIGVAGAMAAAAAVDAMGGTVRQALDAASVSLQNTMGSVCDPVGGGCEIPCHTRNGAAAAAAFTTADLIMAGYPNPIPLDEAVDASYLVGTALPSELRCTAGGGIAVCPSAQRLVL